MSSRREVKAENNEHDLSLMAVKCIEQNNGTCEYTHPFFKNKIVIIHNFLLHAHTTRMHRYHAPFLSRRVTFEDSVSVKMNNNNYIRSTFRFQLKFSSRLIYNNKSHCSVNIFAFYSISIFTVLFMMIIIDIVMLLDRILEVI